MIAIESRRIQDGATSNRDGEDAICKIFAIKSVNRNHEGEDAMVRGRLYDSASAMEKLCNRNEETVRMRNCAII